jgi:hypothetical protein
MPELESALATVTLYRLVGTAELELIKRASWSAFPAMPPCHEFYLALGVDGETLAQYINDPEGALREYEYDLYDSHAARMAESWSAWGNDPTKVYTVAFEVEEHSPIGRLPQHTSRYDVNEVNRSLIGLISLEATFEAD